MSREKGFLQKKGINKDNGGFDTINKKELLYLVLIIHII